MGGGGEEAREGIPGMFWRPRGHVVIDCIVIDCITDYIFIIWSFRSLFISCFVFPSRLCLFIFFSCNFFAFSTLDIVSLPNIIPSLRCFICLVARDYRKSRYWYLSAAKRKSEETGCAGCRWAENEHTDVAHLSYCRSRRLTVDPPDSHLWSPYMLHRISIVQIRPTGHVPQTMQGIQHNNSQPVTRARLMEIGNQSAVERSKASSGK